MSVSEEHVKELPGAVPEELSGETWAPALLELSSKVDAYFAAAGPGPYGSDDKSSKHDIVTAHDVAVQSLACSFLSERFEGSSFLCEEEGVSSPPVPGRPRWIIDPIDGTSNFASGLPVWCLSVACEVDGQVVSSMIHAPALAQTFVAVKDKAYRRRPLPGIGFGVWELMAPAAQGTRFLALSSVPNGSTYEMYDDAEGFAHRLKEGLPSIRNFSSAALEIAWTAAGDSSACFNFHTKPWDTAAGMHLLECSGGRAWVWPQPPSSPYAGDNWYCRGRYLAVSGRCPSGDPYEEMMVREISGILGCEPEGLIGA